ncbi:hypothetical protein A33M_2484 [Rhodovulum sp. PH10]|nr:hypothetical protein A33M_2484 [Rhodovulum sp. PH10]
MRKFRIVRFRVSASQLVTLLRPTDRPRRFTQREPEPAMPLCHRSSVVETAVSTAAGRFGFCTFVHGIGPAFAGRPGDRDPRRRPPHTVDPS